jgi:membrane-associated phospholipid phosphatase
MNPDRKKRYAAAAFLTLLTLSVFWPSPIVSANRLWFGERISVDELSFLGREAPSWDVVFWCLAGLLLIAMIQTAESGAKPREPWELLRGLRIRQLRPALAALAAGAALTTAVWLIADMPMLAFAEGVRADWIANTIRILNRLGGGMNPAIIVAFFAVAGVCYLDRRWVALAVGMGAAGLFAGIAAQIVKHIIGRARPELWLGTAHYAPGSSTSFPSGHTVGAFALAGVLLFGARSMWLRVIAVALAALVGLSRVFAFRHWLSDVTASAVIGLVVAWVVWRGLDVEAGVPTKKILSS